MRLSNKYIKLLVALCSVLIICFVTLIICDQLLKLFNFPSNTLKVSHSPNMNEVRKNIEFTYHFKTNIIGLRDREISTTKPNSTKRILFIGDSFTEGIGVEESNRFTNILNLYFNQLATKTEIINGGLSGTGPLEYARLFIHTERTLKPDVLIICIYANDLSNIPLTYTSNMLYNSETNASVIISVIKKIIPRIYTLVKNIKNKLAPEHPTNTTDFKELVYKEAHENGISDIQFNNWLSHINPGLIDATNKNEFNGSMLSYGLLRPSYWTDALDIDSPEAKQKWINMKLILETIINTAKQYNIKTGIVFIPCKQQYDCLTFDSESPWIQAGMPLRKSWLTDTSAIQQQLQRLTQINKIPFLDLTFSFREHIKKQNNITWKLDEHFTSKGHRLAAKDIAAWMIQTKLQN